MNHQSKAAMEAGNTLSAAPALQGARRATGDAGAAAAPGAAAGADMEVVAGVPKRRRFTNVDKRRILEAADRYTQPGEIGALMRREGVYSSSLSTLATPAQGH